MARIRSVDFLPEIFQTPANKKFLEATLDQLIQEPKLKQTQGYIGRTNAPGKLPTDGYVLEPTDRRTNYQLEPGVIFKDENGNTVDAMTYMGLLDGLNTNGANVENHDRLFRSETYSWSPFIDFDKFVNYSQYFWLPNGPDSVNVSAIDVFLTGDFDVTANDNDYAINGFGTANPTIAVLRGGSYNFIVDEAGSEFYIQTQPGVDGTLPWADNISSRDVLGVTNNGDDVGTITFDVPASTAQQFYHDLVVIGDVDLAITDTIASLQGELVDDVIDINGIQDFEGKTAVFINDPLAVGQVYQIQFVGTGPTATIDIVASTAVALLERFTIQYGDVYSNVSFYRNASGLFEAVPLETASLDTLYYQDASNPARYGIINVLDLEDAATLNVTNIIGRETYTSPNGVVFTNGLKVKFRGDIIPAEYTDKDYYVEGVGTAIRLVAATDLVVPEAYAQSNTSPWDIFGWDTEGYDGTLNAPTSQDYITINRSSIDRNAWSRSNRWCHIDVITATAAYNETVVNVDNTTRASRPIIEFDADLRLFDYGTNGKQIVNIIDFNTTDAMSTVNGSTGFAIDGYRLQTGSRVIFANDTDPAVKDKIFDVELIDANDDGNEEVNLTLADDADSEINDIIVIGNGLTLKGSVYRYTGTEWDISQAKTSVNQAPLFDIFDREGNSFSEFEAYPSTTFAGTKLFSYAEGTGTNDTVLGFPLRYLNINNLGDIVFDNNLYTDTFLYVEGQVSHENSPVSDGIVRKYSTRTDYTEELGWVTSVEPSYQPQIFDTVYTGADYELDITPTAGLLIPSVQITANGEFVNSTNYTVTGKIISFQNNINEDDELQIKVISEDISAIGYYEVPGNLTSNMFNENISLLTLGTVRNHYNALAQNILTIEGEINGANNIRDLGAVSKYGNLIVQQSAPLALTAMFMRSKEYNFFSAVEFNARQYEKFKNQLMNWVEHNDIFDMTSAEILDAAIKDINIGKNIDSSFYWSDMLPTGEDYETTEYIITAISTDTYTTLNSYDFLNANTQAMLVYHNGTLLTKDTDYTVATDGPRITLLITLAVDDILIINEYNTTVGANVPSTPTKLGLYPKYKPMIFTDDTYVNATDVVRGHDGSITATFGDARDDVLLEFEKRVYNNIKVNDIIPIEPTDVVPGVFRSTDYTQEEVTAALAPSLLSWLGWNRIDYKRQDYNAAEEKTWNYSASSCKVTGEQVTKGNWRGLYNCYYDTNSPHTRPWEMLGFTEQPDWWTNYYGAAPYTSGNLVLWDDIEAGLVRDPDGSYVIEKYKRPGLTTVLPVDSEGNLVMPLASVISDYTQYDFRKSWSVGDMGPAEAAWARSSAGPFAMMVLYALTKPAQFFALMADRDRYVYDATVGQYLYDERHRLDVRNMDLLDENNVKHSYINWIIDYNSHFGYNSLAALKIELSNLDVNLCHHMASFTDKNNLKIFTDKSSPDSTNSSLLLPDESFKLLLYKNQPLDEIIYSSVIVQKTTDGYAVIGNSVTDPYFNIQVPVQTGKFSTVDVGRTNNTTTSVRIPIDYTDTVEYIPYGQVFSSKQAVATFLASYSEYLTRAGLKFTTMDKAQEVSWTQMVQEFIYWADQGWAVDSIVNLNPSATELEFERELHIVDDLNNLELTEQPLNQNREPLDISDYTVDRLDNNFKIRMLDDNIISYLKFNLTSFEHLLILDNVSIFNDLIYDPVSGVRQQRVKLSGFTTYDWIGQLDAPGFLYNEDNVQDWSEVITYNKGDIVKFKNAYWSASEKVQPSESFNFGQWVKTDYASINKGLLPNLATKAEQMLDYYNNKTANLESDIDLMAYGLTGFRSRDYLQSLDLDDISQVNIYSDMIQNKGTGKSLDLFKDVTLSNELVDYTVSENWAIRRAQYGATGNRSYIELQLNGELLTASPGLVEIVDAVTDASVSDQVIPVNNIYKQSEKNTDKNIFPVIDERNPDTSLPTAGAVNSNDVDIAVFNFADLDVTTGVDEGTLVWVAKDTDTDWNVYRAVRLDVAIIAVNDNLDGTLTLITNTPHNLVAEDSIVVVDTDDQVNGTQAVLSVFESINIVIAGELAPDQTCIVDLEGSILKFESARVGVPSDIAGSIFDNNIHTPETVWVDSHHGKSATYVKTAPFALTRSALNPAETTTEFGTSVSQGYLNSGLLVGDPALNNGTAYLYNKDGVSDYRFQRALTLTNHTDILRYGEKVTLINEWGAISGPGSAVIPGVAAIVNRNKLLNFIIETQILRNPFPGDTDGYGTSLAMSKDENWVVVGEPAKNRVHTYQKREYQVQNVSFVSDGIETTYDVSGSIVATAANEVNVLVDSVLLTTPAEYTFDGTNIVLVSAPTAGAIITVSRKDSILDTGDNIQTAYPVTDLYARDGIDSMIVKLESIIQRPDIDYTYDGSNINFLVAPLLGANISIAVATTYRYVDTLDGTTHGAIADDRFGEEIDITENGSHIVVTAPGYTAITADSDLITADDNDTTVNGSTNTEPGSAYIFNRVTERFVISDDLDLTYTTIRTPLGSVFKNGTQLISDDNNIGEQYSISGNDVTLEAGVLNIGDFLDVDASEFKLMQIVTAATPTAGAAFGSAVSICKSKCSIYFGARNDLEGQGSVTRYINHSRMASIITATVQNPVIPAGASLRINNFEVQLPVGGTSQDVADAITATTIPNVLASAADGYLTIELLNKSIISIANRLDVFPGENVSLVTLGLEPYAIGQTITSPTTTTQAQHFGSALHIDINMNQLVVGATRGDAVYDNAYTSDNTAVTADQDITADAAQLELDTGVVYTYDLLSDGALYTPGKLVLGQEIIDNDLAPGDRFGGAVNLVDGVLVVGSTDFNSNTGRIVIYGNTANTLSWVATNVQNDTVDTELMNSVYVYDSETLRVNRYLDFIDPLNGKILGAAQQNIDFITVYDPTVYGDTAVGLLWGKEQVGKIWWDVTSVRFLDYNLSDAKYASKIWGSVFSGSTVDVYQWIESNVIPSEYTGTGTVYDTDKFVTMAELDRSGILRNTYYYWVNKVETISTNSEKTLSASAIASYIESPSSSGISYAAFIAPNLIGLYNSKEIIDDTTSVIHVEYDKTKNDDNVFVEYDLFRENHPTDFLSDSLYKKLQDSLCGVDSLGNLVPDVGLSLADRFGIEFRPRKSMFVDRNAALTEYMLKANEILARYTIAEARSYTLLNSEEAAPSVGSGEWDQQLADDVELSYQDLATVATGWSYLVDTDSTRDGLWTIYEVTEEDDLRLKRVQRFDTKRFWNLVTWYAEDFNEFSKIDYVVEEFTALATLSNVENDAIAKVLHNSIGNWELHRFTDGEWTRVALEDGTIQIDSRIWDYQAGRYGWDVEVWDSQNNDEEPVDEMRQIIRSINEELLVGDLALERNVTIMTVINYILAEQPNVDWLYKTSLIDVSQKARSLVQYAVYQKDNQDYLLDYIKEAKPYHTKVKDFLISYDGIDTFEGSVTDFDCPSQYSAEFEQYISPVLDDGATLETDPSNKLASDEIWETEPYKQWFDNYRLTVNDVLITNAGTGYTIAPEVTVTGDSTTPAELVARLGTGGSISEIIIVEAGSGYTETPVITFSGGNGIDAAALAVMGNNLVRTFGTTVKYDRYEYQTNIVIWEADVAYAVDQLVKADGAVYEIIDTAAASTFNPALHTLIPIEDLSGIDRTFGYYESDVNSPGLDLSLLINGISFPGVEVDGVGFDLGTGFDISTFDIVSFDNITIGPEGLPTYSEDLIDTAYESAFLDTYLGTRATDINIEGGAFVDTYHSHAPEELVPGSIFDTLDIKVFARPGSDFLEDGHAFDIQGVVYEAVASTQTFSFEDIAKHPIKILVANVTTGVMLYETIDFTVDWPNQAVTITAGMTAGDNVKIFVYEIGGGNQLHRDTLLGSEVTVDTFTVPVANTEIYEAIVFVDGVEDTGVTTAAVNAYTASITLSATPAATAFITVTIFGTDVPQYEESYPVIQTFIADTDTPDITPEGFGKYKHNAIVEVEGLRLRPPEVGRHYADGIANTFFFPLNGGYLFDSVANNEVDVYLNNTLLVQGVDYTVSPPSPASATFGTGVFGTSSFATSSSNPARYVTLTVTPTATDIVEVYVRHAADYWWTGTEVVFNVAPTAGDLIAVTTFKDDSELDIFTQVFVGPTLVSEEAIDAFDNAGFDEEVFDASVGVDSEVNIFTIDRLLLINGNRLWVTVNGERLHAGIGYGIVGDNLIELNLPVIQPTDVVAVTSVTENIIVSGANFRLFKDMRDNVAMYRMSDLSMTQLTVDLAAADDIIYVADASILGTPDLTNGVFGIVIINGERITYRERDLVANTVSGLRRGTAGTGVPALHSTDDVVHDVSAKSFVPYLEPTGSLGFWDIAETYIVGDIVKYNGIYWHAYNTPTVGEFNETEWSRHDVIWYEQGVSTASNGVPLQDQNTAQAIFIKK